MGDEKMIALAGLIASRCERMRDYLRFSIILLGLGLVGCAPSEEEGFEPTQVEPDVDTSGLLSVTPPSSFDFSQFYSVVIQMNTEVVFSNIEGQYIHVQLTDNQGNKYWLNQVSQTQSLDVNVSVPLSATHLYLEFYTELNEEGVLEEVVL